MIQHVFDGLQILMSVEVLFLVSVGVMMGMIIGSLPGLTATMGVALLLPLTFSLDSTTGILLLIGIYVGAIYGGSISAILINTPGTPASAATTFDGYPMTKRGEAGRALGISLFSSFGGGTISVLALMLISPLLANLALRFSSPETFALAVFGLTVIISLSSDSMSKGLVAGLFGLIIATAGTDNITGYVRFGFGSTNLISGFAFIPVLIGLFAMSQAFITIDGALTEIKVKEKVQRIIPSLRDFRRITITIIRSGAIGTVIGSIPGAGGDIGAFISYNEAKRFSKRPEKFGTGIPEGVAAPEAGNNGVTGGSLIPLLSLGIPGDAVAAVLLGALMMKHLRPGPELFNEHTDILYAIFLGMLFAYIVMLVFGLVAIRLFIKLLSMPKSILVPAIIVLCVVGSFAIQNNFFDVYVMFAFGVIGYFMQKFKFPVSPIIIALILGPLAESELRRSLMMSNGDWTVFLTRPISATLLTFALLTVIMELYRKYRKRLKNEAAHEK